MNILVVTEFYRISENMGYGSSSAEATPIVNDFVKYWAMSGNNVVVAIQEFVPLNEPQGIYRFVKKGTRIHNHLIDGANVLISLRSFIPLIKKKVPSISDYSEILNKKLKELHFNPDIIVSHIPTWEVWQIVPLIDANCPRVGVLHGTDVELMASSAVFKKQIEDSYDIFFSRSIKIREKAQMAELKKLNKTIISSGVMQPCNNINDRNYNLGEKIEILYAGDLIEKKNVDTIINAVSQLKNKWHLTIVGDGVCRKDLEELSRSLGCTDRISFSGKKTHDEVYDYMAKSDIFVMVSRNETLGLVYLEAMSSGCIVIGSSGEGIDGIIIDGRNGFLVSPGDIKELSDCFDKIINMSKSELTQISYNALKTGQEHSYKNMADIYLNDLRNLIKQYTF